MARHVVPDGTVVLWDVVTRVMQIGHHRLVISSAAAVSMPERRTLVTAIGSQEEGAAFEILAPPGAILGRRLTSPI